MIDQKRIIADVLPRLGKHFAMMKASDMVLVDYDGNIVQGKKV